MSVPEKTEKSIQLYTLLKQLFSFAAPWGNTRLWMRVWLALLCLFLAKGSNLVTPLLYGKSVDLVNQDNGFSVYILLYLLGGYALARLGQQIFSEAKEYLFSRISQRAVRGAALSAFRHLHALSLKFHLDRQTGGVSRAVDRGAKGIEFVITRAIFDVLPLFVEVCFVSLLLWFLFGPLYAVIIFCTVMFYVWFTIQVTEWRMFFRRQMNKADEKAATCAIDSLLNYETVKYFNAEEIEAERYDSSMRVYEDAAVLSRTSLAAVNIGQGFIIAVGLVLIMGLAGRDIASEALSVGDFVTVNTYLIQLYLPLNFLGFVYREIRQSLIDIEQMFSLMREHKDITDKLNASPLRLGKGDIEFRNVVFSYGKRVILNNISFYVAAGKKVAIVGESGAGKTTLSRLLLRFYDPQEGCILIDGQDIREVEQASVRAAIGVVPQDTVMFNASIGYNISYGRPDATDSEIGEAARLAAIDSFVKSLPHGYEERVGERGLKLSGGEKQRVAIARAILKRPYIFLFDEATSALDTQTEREIQEALNQVSRCSTTIVIAHRLSTIIDADEIFVITKGEIAERGTHEELLSSRGLYHKMWQRQSRQSSTEPPSPPAGEEIGADVA